MIQGGSGSRVGVIKLENIMTITDSYFQKLESVIITITIVTFGNSNYITITAGQINLPLQLYNEHDPCATYHFTVKSYFTCKQPE